MAAASSLADVAVVVPTVLRPTLARAVRSVFRQSFEGTIQVLIGIDQRLGDASQLATLLAECPPNVALTVFDPGYSTARAHGGFYPNAYSGALRTILSYAANARLVATLDDDDWWSPGHLAGLAGAIAGKTWAFSRRWLVDAETGWPICPDEWDSLGPGEGINAERFGGFVCPSTLMLDKEACHFVLPFWALSPFPDGTGEDRLVFEALRQQPWGASGRATCFYRMPRAVQQHPHHAREFAARGLTWMGDAEAVAAIRRHAEEAAAALARQDLAQATAAARVALARNPHHPSALRTLACAAWQAGDRTSARVVIEQALAVDEEDPAILAARAAIAAAADGQT